MALDRGEDDPRLPYAMGSAEELPRSRGESRGGARATPLDREALAAVVADAEKRWGGLDVIVPRPG